MKSIFTLPLHVMALVCAHTLAFAQFAPAPVLATSPVGEVKGSAVQHTAVSAEGVVQRAAVVIPANATGGEVYVGPFSNAPKDI